MSLVTLTEEDLIDADFDTTNMTPSQFAEIVRQMRQYYLMTFSDNLSDFASKIGVPRKS